jgi:hypothetical protein
METAALGRVQDFARRRKWRWITGGVVVTSAVVVVAVIKTTEKHEPQPSQAGLNGAPATVAVGADTPPPWPAPVDVTGAVRAAGLPLLGSEGQVEHIHVHLDVVVDGHPVQVPAGIGIDPVHRAISPLHTHDTSGVIHIESPVQRQFSLGEFFSEWGVSLSADNISALRAVGGKTLRAYVNGTLRTDNPAAVTFEPHDEIALIYGVPQAGETIPARFDFPRGD